MVKKFIIVFVLLFFGAAAYFIFCGESEEQKIRKMLNRLCTDCAKNKESSSAAALVVKTNVLKNYFTDRLLRLPSFPSGKLRFPPQPDGLRRSW